MANATPSRLGQVNGAGATDALFLKVFAGEVMSVFETANVTSDKHVVRTIESGKSASFPILGRTTAAYHAPGTEITGNVVAQNEVVINVNDKLISSVFISDIDEAMNHFDVRSHFTKEIGNALANQFDRHVLQTLVQAAKTSTPAITGESTMVGTQITDADANTNADSLIQSIFDAAASLDSKNVPDADRFVYLAPQQYYMLVNSSSKLINAEYGNAGNGSIAGGRVLNVAGMSIVKTNQLPTTSIGTGTVNAGTGDRQKVDATNTVALIAHKSAAGTVKLMDLGVEKEYDIRRQGTLLVAKYAYGHGVLRPEAAALIKTA